MTRSPRYRLGLLLFLTLLGTACMDLTAPDTDSGDAMKAAPRGISTSSSEANGISTSPGPRANGISTSPRR